MDLVAILAFFVALWPALGGILEQLVRLFQQVLGGG